MALGSVVSTLPDPKYVAELERVIKALESNLSDLTQRVNMLERNR